MPSILHKVIALLRANMHGLVDHVLGNQSIQAINQYIWHLEHISTMLNKLSESSMDKDIQVLQEHLKQRLHITKSIQYYLQIMLNSSASADHILRWQYKRADEEDLRFQNWIKWRPMLYLNAIEVWRPEHIPTEMILECLDTNHSSNVEQVVKASESTRQIDFTSLLTRSLIARDTTTIEELMSDLKTKSSKVSGLAQKIWDTLRILKWAKQQYLRDQPSKSDAYLQQIERLTQQQKSLSEIRTKISYCMGDVRYKQQALQTILSQSETDTYNPLSSNKIFVYQLMVLFQIDLRQIIAHMFDGKSLLMLDLYMRDVRTHVETLTNAIPATERTIDKLIREFEKISEMAQKRHPEFDPQSPCDRPYQVRDLADLWVADDTSNHYQLIDIACLHYKECHEQIRYANSMQELQIHLNRKLELVHRMRDTMQPMIEYEESLSDDVLESLHIEADAENASFQTWMEERQKQIDEIEDTPGIRRVELELEERKRRLLGKNSKNNK